MNGIGFSHKTGANKYKVFTQDENDADDASRKVVAYAVMMVMMLMLLG
jgi:hypothetical protein